MDTQPLVREPHRPLKGLEPLVHHELGGRWEILSARARRRRVIANVVVFSTSAAMVALALILNLVLSR
jgi:hypothetical protein